MEEGGREGGRLVTLGVGECYVSVCTLGSFVASFRSPKVDKTYKDYYRVEILCFDDLIKKNCSL